MSSFNLSESSNTIVLAKLRTQYQKRKDSGEYPPQQSQYHGSIEVPKHCQFMIIHYLVERILSNPNPFTESIDNLFDMQLNRSMVQVLSAKFENTYFERSFDHHTLRVFLSVNNETKAIVLELYTSPFQLQGSFDKEFESFLLETKIWYNIQDAVMAHNDECILKRKPYEQEFEEYIAEHIAELYTHDITIHPPQPEPYQVPPGDIYCTSVNSPYYDNNEVDNIVYIGMCNLYEKVIPQAIMTDEIYDKMVESGIQPPEAHMPCHTILSDISYIYMSEYTHNKLEVMITEHNPGRFNSVMYVRFTIVPKYRPTVECDMECRQIENLVIDNIYEKLQQLFDYIEQNEWKMANEPDRDSYIGGRLY